MEEKQFSKDICIQAECELKEVAEDVLHIKKNVIEVFVNDGFLEDNVKIYKISSKPRSFVEKYEVFVESVTGNKDKEIKLFIKKLKKPNSEIKPFPGKDLFSIEVFLYTQLAKIITDLQNETDMPNNQKYKMVKFYNSLSVDTVIMENMTQKGYKIFDKKQAIPLKYAENAVKELAKFHSFSFVLKHTNPKLYNELVETKQNILNLTEDFVSWTANLYNNCIDVLYSEEAKMKMAKFRDHRLEKYNNYYKNTESIQCVLCHGDYKVDNIFLMIKDGKLSELVPIDYQLAYYGHPLNDFFYFIFSSTDQRLRRSYLTFLKNLYYRSLRNFLRHFKIEIEKVYPKDLFEKDYKERMEVGLMMAIEVLPFTLAPDNDASDVSDVLEKISKQNLYVKRINEVVEDFIERRYL